MSFQKIIKKDDGTQIKIEMWVELSFSETVNIQYTVLKKEKGKRTWVLPFDKTSQEYRGLKLQDRFNHAEQDFLKVVTQEEIELAKLEAIEKISNIMKSIKPHSRY